MCNSKAGRSNYDINVPSLVSELEAPYGYLVKYRHPRIGSVCALECICRLGCLFVGSLYGRVIVHNFFSCAVLRFHFSVVVSNCVMKMEGDNVVSAKCRQLD